METVDLLSIVPASIDDFWQRFRVEQKSDQLKSRGVAPKRKFSPLNDLNHDSTCLYQRFNSFWHHWFHFHLLHSTFDLKCQVFGVEAGEMQIPPMKPKI